MKVQILKYEISKILELWNFKEKSSKINFQGKLFPGSETLLSIADELREIRTICDCGKKAIMVVRLDSHGKVIKEGAQIEIGGNEKYVSLCRKHWKIKLASYD